MFLLFLTLLTQSNSKLALKSPRVPNSYSSVYKSSILTDYPGMMEFLDRIGESQHLLCGPADGFVGIIYHW